MSPRQRVLYSITSVVMSLLLSVGFAVWYVGYQNQKWCDTLAIFTESNPRDQALPTTQAGRDQRAAQIRVYDALVTQRRTFNCPGVAP
jgi:hypothetical protein